ncbi:hypothetical protein [Streptomyces sp. NPDC051098]|uniref:hypothetical protein n=1 Tax=Streptomyces sp. NPDC051098 TaxID=3155411 RepID=UPI00342CE803
MKQTPGFLVAWERQRFVLSQPRDTPSSASASGEDLKAMHDVGPKGLRVLRDAPGSMASA